MVFIKNQQKIIPVEAKKIKKAAERILASLRISGYELSVLLLDNKGIRAVNKKYLNRNRPTNVISFSLTEGEFGNINPHVLGDVVISVEKALEQAETRGTSLEEELTFLLIHGILHLMGYDHEKKGSEREKMRKKEKEVYKVVMGKKLT
ncbi:MAG TPA: rRNA maturation RNase YbeY [Thermodesulfobacteriota bacterium]|nr:rRNA maturation RNase YbeY [Thermodesulfobacteriota bacterium]